MQAFLMFLLYRATTGGVGNPITAATAVWSALCQCTISVVLRLRRTRGDPQLLLLAL